MFISNDWFDIVKTEYTKKYFLNLWDILESGYYANNVLPSRDLVFRALNLTAYNDVKCVIVGQDPYPREEDACGLAFSVGGHSRIPATLSNIFKELYSDLGLQRPSNGDLTKWAENGVLLLNSVLTVRKGRSRSHVNIGWEPFTDKIVSALNDREKPVVFILWGNDAYKKRLLINNYRHYVIVSPHPSPLSAYKGFFGSKPFSATNEFLKMNGMIPLDWSL
jgi:uracil-DNA glycosylase